MEDGPAIGGEATMDGDAKDDGVGALEAGSECAARCFACLGRFADSLSE